MDHYETVKQDLAQNGFFPESIEADGKIHRFKLNAHDKNPDAFYICFYNKIGKTEFLAGAYGDWHFDSWRTFCTHISLSAEDKAKHYARAEKVFKKEQIERWEKTAIASAEFLEKFASSEGLNEYLTNKKIKGLHGAKMSGSELLVPVEDVDGKIWGFQKIFADGKKLFQPGTKKAGHFFMLGKSLPRDTIYLCEGFATGCSIFDAIERPVCVCFDAGNLVNVARIIREKYPDCSLIVCGDDDAFTEGNPGKTKAIESAGIGLGSHILPKFENLATSPTDFNDLHVLEGLTKVREQILGSEKKQFYVKCLGFRGNSYFYTSSHNLQVLEIVSHSETDLLKLMPESYWLSKYANKKGNAIQWNKAKSDLMEGCRERGIFVRQKIRGNGVWIDGDKVVTHLGDRLFYDGDAHHLHSLGSDFFYELDNRLPEVDTKPLTVEELDSFRDTLSKFNYSTPQQAMFLSGWMALAPVCGILPWRPHLWLTGEPGSGKTTIKDFVDEHLLHAFKRLSVIGSTSEAGIRQALRAAAIPLVFDEFEPEGKKGISRVEDCLDLTRQASSEQKGEIVKGSGEGQSVSYYARYMALFSSVKPRLIAEADKSRFTYIELNKSAHSGDQWDALKKAMKLTSPEFSRRLFSRTIRMIPVILKNIKTYQRAFVDIGATQRVGQQYGTLVAGWNSLVSDDVVSLEAATSLVRLIPLESEDSISSSRDQEECIHYLLNKFIRYNDVDTLIIKMIHEVSKHSHLENYGMKILDGNLFIASTNPQVDRIFENSKWGSSWKQILKRLDGVKINYPAKLNKKTTKGLLVPSIYFDEETIKISA